MAFSELENRIIHLCSEDPINIEAVQRLFDQGADPNAVDDWDDFEQEYTDVLFTACIFETQWDAPDFYPLLKCFLKNGLDIQRFADFIIGDLIFLGNNDRFRLTQLVFDHLSEKVSLKKALDKVGTEASFYNCNREFYNGEDSSDWEANDLDGLYELIEAYEKGEDYDGFKQLPKEINQKLVSIKISGNWISADEEKMVYRYKGNTVFMILELEQDVLIIRNGFTAFINNKSNMEKLSNDFSLRAESLLKGENVERVDFHPYSINVTEKYPQDGRTWFLDGRMVSIEFSGGKRIVFTTDNDAGNDTVFLQVM